MEEKLRKLRELTPMSTADIIEPFDPEDAQEIRIKVNNLPKTDVLHLPELTSITMFGTYEAFYRHRKQVKMYKDEIGAFLKGWGNGIKEFSKKILTDLGGSVTTEVKNGRQVEKVQPPAASTRRR